MGKWLLKNIEFNNAQLILLLMLIMIFFTQIIVMSIQYTIIHNKYIDIVNTQKSEGIHE